jgi:hypothetical protein
VTKTKVKLCEELAEGAPISRCMPATEGNYILKNTTKTGF